MSTAAHVESLRRPVAPFAVAAAVVAGSSAVHLLNHALGEHGSRLFDSSFQWSYTHLLATMSFAAATLACGYGTREAVSRRRAWALACGVFAILAVDGAARLHLHISWWPALFAPLLAALTVAVLVIAAGTDYQRIVIGAVALLAGSMAIHVLGPHALELFGGRNPESWAYQVKIAIKEATELAGWVLLVPALVSLARRAGRASGA